MFVETSTIVGILLEEPDKKDLLARLHAAVGPVTSVVNEVEAAISIGRRIRDFTLAGKLVGDFLEKAGIRVLPVTPDIYEDLVRAYARYGKGTGHAAKLNFGDCFSYAIAKQAGIRLLCKGNDFTQTDISLA